MNGQKKWKLSIPLLIIEVLVLMIAIGVLYVITATTSEIERTAIDEDNIIINEEVVETKKEKEEEKVEEVKKGYRNIALFGVDARDGELGRGTRSDTSIIASIKQDTYLNLGNDTYNKCNGAYAKGGPEQAITMLNMNLDLDITDYVTVGFSGLIDAIDCLGGIEIEITEAEINHLNNYQLCMAEEMGVDYCRIRYTKGDDFRRAERQRDVLGAMMIKAKGASLTTLRDVVTAVLPSINTSLSVNEIISVLGTVAEYNVVTSDGFPFQNKRVNVTIGSKGDCIIPTTLDENVSMLHELLYGNPSYTPSKQVMELSGEIARQADEFMP